MKSNTNNRLKNIDSNQEALERHWTRVYNASLSRLSRDRFPTALQTCVAATEATRMVNTLKASTRSRT